ncbi:MAG: acetyl-CoA carboxylase biotin carboxylase subunit [Candidatus Methanofastidiosa archaeon]|jgi:acetyl-CoA carboxylase biotin carboxylase subunit|nr:acetyl-CoA carboxylase biotin carboxylase subunit [Candidatus Methanofastidiosa archaeon]
MFKKVLIANRGEIAVRIIRACKELGVATVAVYSDADAEALHVKLADEAVNIGPAPATKSYLNMMNIINAAIVTGAEGIHPGYGFLAENSRFSKLCRANGIKFIGPSPESIDLMGDKATAKKTMKESKVPVTPGSDGIVRTFEEVKAVTDKIGFPVILKATAGGGGKGMRVVRSEKELPSLLRQCQAEAQSGFGNPDVYVERYVEVSRHVEIQIIADAFGNAIYLGERDCSIQRRHQKLVEEGPSPAINEETRKKMGDAAVRAALAAKYEGAGTVEFLYDDERNEFYFMEMNTRVQVEHCVTEMTTDIDIVKTGIRIAAGEKMPYKQEDVRIKGHAIECRINAEDPDTYIPSPGKITKLILSGGPFVRVDTAMYEGYEIPPYYDSLIAKLLVWGEDRDEAIARMKRALEETIIEGVSTTIPFHLKVMDNKVFQVGKFHTDFIEKHLKPAKDGGE